MTQPTLDFEAHKLARTTDPATSKLGAIDVAPRLAGLHATVLSMVERYPGHTSSELAKYCGVPDPRRINRRLPELEVAGQVVRCETRKCKVTGRVAATWRPRA